ncbi:MAG: hypothetical protein Q9192_004374, partial [Flavoplaca navasiana]
IHPPTTSPSRTHLRRSSPPAAKPRGRRRRCTRPACGVWDPARYAGEERGGVAGSGLTGVDGEGAELGEGEEGRDA